MKRTLFLIFLSLFGLVVQAQNMLKIWTEPRFYFPLPQSELDSNQALQ
jgi:hypothetical protein